MKSDTPEVGGPPLSGVRLCREDDRGQRLRNVADRIEFLSQVEDGWFEGRGVAPDSAGLLWLNQQLQGKYVGTELPLPRLYPTEPGGVIGEWSLDRHVCGLEIDLEARTGSWFDVDRETHEGIDERILDLDSSDDWRWLTGRLGRFVGELG